MEVGVEEEIGTTIAAAAAVAMEIGMRMEKETRTAMAVTGRFTWTTDNPKMKKMGHHPRTLHYETWLDQKEHTVAPIGQSTHCNGSNSDRSRYLRCIHLDVD